MPRLQFESFVTRMNTGRPGPTREYDGASDLKGLSSSRTFYRLSASPG